jgi:hypothetical protein
LPASLSSLPHRQTDHSPFHASCLCGSPLGTGRRCAHHPTAARPSQSEHNRPLPADGAQLGSRQRAGMLLAIKLGGHLERPPRSPVLSICYLHRCSQNRNLLHPSTSELRAPWIAQNVGRFAEVASELDNVPHIDILGFEGKITDLHVLEHPMSKLSHRSSLRKGMCCKQLLHGFAKERLREVETHPGRLGIQEDVSGQVQCLCSLIPRSGLVQFNVPVANLLEMSPASTIM